MVLLFLKPKQLGAPTPLKKQLVGYQRVHVAKGASATVTFDDIDAKSIAMVSTAGDRVSMAGEFELEARPALLRSWAYFQAPSQTRMSHSAC